MRSLVTFVLYRISGLCQCSPLSVVDRWGLNPRMGALQTQPTVSPTLVHHIQRGNVRVVPNIRVRIAGFI